MEAQLQRPAAGPRVVGKHVYGNLIDCQNVEALRSPEILERIIVEAAEAGNMALLDVKSWKIGEGVSIVAIILESHITIHTWPEFGYATVDVYSCGDHTDPKAAFDYIVEALKPLKIEYGLADRSLE